MAEKPKVSKYNLATFYCLPKRSHRLRQLRRLMHTAKEPAKRGLLFGAADGI